MRSILIALSVLSFSFSFVSCHSPASDAAASGADSGKAKAVEAIHNPGIPVSR